MLKRKLLSLLVIALLISPSLILFTDFKFKNELVFFLDNSELLLIFEDFFFNPLILFIFFSLPLIFLILKGFTFSAHFYLKETPFFCYLLNKSNNRSPPQSR
ncbi:hypothetical protein HRbin35_00614 [bacterium HR35]|nr:hypothetical protein HRbin35_00614 [bacterium HR35]